MKQPKTSGETKHSRGRDPVEFASQLHDVAVTCCSKANYRKARTLCRRALSILRFALGSNHPDVANVLHTFATIEERDAKPVSAERIYRRSLQIAEKAEQNRDVDALCIQVLTSLARLYQGQGRYDEAEAIYQRALARAEQTSNDPVQLARVLNSLASLWRDTLRFAEAAKTYERVLTVKKRALGTSHPQVADTYFSLSSLQHQCGHNVVAAPLARRALKIHESALGTNHPDVAEDVALLAAILATQKKYKAAEPLYQRALAGLEKAYGSHHQQVAVVLNNLAALYQARGDAAKTMQLYERVLRIKEKNLGPEHPDIATTLNNLAVLNRGLGRFAEARQLYGRAMKILQSSVGASDPRMSSTLRNYARLLRVEADAIQKRARQMEKDRKTTSKSAAKHPNVNPQVAHFRLTVRPSRIHRWGVFADQAIPAGKEVIEYTGERISRNEMKRRSRRKLVYLFRLNPYWGIDGAVGGSGAQYVNHSCDPNIVSRQIDGRMFYFSKRRISAGEELFLDYKFKKVPKLGLGVPCNCGAPNCRGTINRK